MRSPVDIIKGRITGYDERSGELTIKAQYPDWPMMVKREYRDCRIQLIDGRPLSGKQRNVCYKLIREIARNTGNCIDDTKETLKQKYINEELYDGMESDFSLSDAPMSTVCAFQRYLVRFMLDFDIPSSFSLLEFVDDVQDYLYACLVHTKCCICGKPADCHHVERVGMGRDRHDIIHEGMEALPLCRDHHIENHDLGDVRFFNKYHLTGGVVLDQYLCRIYRLKQKKEEAEYAERCESHGSSDE